MSTDVLTWIKAHTNEMIELQRGLTAIPALGPENGGDGEATKAAYLVAWLRDHGVVGIEQIDIPDERVAGGIRPAVIATLRADDDAQTLWIMSHLDVVPPGDRSMWESDPYQLTVDGDRIIGRGVEDNQQGLVSSVFALLGLQAAGVAPEHSVKLLFVPDEELGSTYGIGYILRELDLFAAGDMFLVPDGGNTDGTMVEVAEKSVMWLEFTTHGRQCHASTPDLGTNAFLAASHLVTRLDMLHGEFPQTNEIFDVPRSTFVPTKKDANVPNVNTMPGEDRFCIDIRVLPEVGAQPVMQRVREMVHETEHRFGVTIDVTTLSRIESQPTPVDAPIVSRLNRAIERIHGRPGTPMGMGGGTVAALLRNAGYHTVVWSTIADTAHMPNEYCLIDNMKNDALVMASLMMGT